MDYQLIALDLDGTLLDSRKEIQAEAVRAVREASAAGKTVVFDTGRAVPELEEPIAILPEVRYAVFASGAGLYDTVEKKAFDLRGIPEKQAKRIFTLAGQKDIMPQIVLADRVMIQASHMKCLDRYHMEVYRPMYEKAMTLVPDIFAFAESCREPFLKINLYHAEVSERDHTRASLETPELELVYSEFSSLECSARGISKGSGLLRLCSLLGIPPEKCIAAGDADNDIPMFRAAGLAVAMGNAPGHVKAAADRTVSDADHGGCVQAIRMLME